MILCVSNLRLIHPKVIDADVTDGCIESPDTILFLQTHTEVSPVDEHHTFWYCIVCHYHLEVGVLFVFLHHLVVLLTDGKHTDFLTFPIIIAAPGVFAEIKLEANLKTEPVVTSHDVINTRLFVVISCKGQSEVSMQFQMVADTYRVDDTKACTDGVFIMAAVTDESYATIRNNVPCTHGVISVDDIEQVEHCVFLKSKEANAILFWCHTNDSLTPIATGLGT